MFSQNNIDFVENNGWMLLYLIPQPKASLNIDDTINSLLEL